MSKITLKGYIVVPDEDLSQVEAELPNHMALTKQESGCLIFNVTQSANHQNVFNVYEEFADRNAFEAHQQRVQASRWAEVTRNVERHYDISED